MALRDAVWTSGPGSVRPGGRLVEEEDEVKPEHDESAAQAAQGVDATRAEAPSTPSKGSPRVIAPIRLSLSVASALSPGGGTPVSEASTLNGDGTVRGSSTAAATARETRGCISVHPDRLFRVVWEVVGIFVLVWVTISVPFKLAFLTESIDDHDPSFFVSVLVNLFFILDLALNFYTGYYDENDVLIMDAVKIRDHYLRTWFAVDFLSAIPFDYLVLAFEGSYVTALQGTKGFRILKLLRLFKMLRVTNLYRFLGRFEENFSQNTVKVFKLVILLILWLHFDACMYFFAARWGEMETGEWHSQSWVVRNGVDIMPVGEQYVWALWHASSHMLSISYGPQNPLLLPEVIATMLSMVCGAGLYASIIGTTASIIQASDPSGTEFYKQWDELKAFMKYKELPAHVRDRLRKYFTARWKSRKVFNEHSILSSLPPPYVRSLLHHECKWLLQSVPLLANAQEGFVNALLTNLQSVLLMEGETVIEEGEPPLRWWLLSSGVVGFYRNGRKFAEMSDGQFFGDASLLWGVKSPFKVVTEVPTQFYALDRQHFEALMSEYPDLVGRMKKDAYKQCRRWGVASMLREAAMRGEHASAFTRISFDWDGAEEELRHEAEATGETLDAVDDLFARDWSKISAANEYRMRANSGSGFTVDGVDVFEHLRRRLQTAGTALRRLPHELHLPGVTSPRGGMHHHGGFGNDGPGGFYTSRGGALDTAAIVHRLRQFGHNVESRAAQLGQGMRENLRTVRDRIRNPGAAHAVTARSERAASTTLQRSNSASGNDIELARATSAAAHRPFASQDDGAALSRSKRLSDGVMAPLRSGSPRSGSPAASLRGPRDASPLRRDSWGLTNGARTASPVASGARTPGGSVREGVGRAADPFVDPQAALAASMQSRIERMRTRDTGERPPPGTSAHQDAWP